MSFFYEKMVSSLFFNRLFFVSCLVVSIHVFASACPTVLVLADAVEEAPDIRARMGFGATPQVPGDPVSNILVLDSNKGEHMTIVVAALVQTNDASPIMKCEYPLVIGKNLEPFLHLFYKENFDVVTSSLNGYLKEEHDFAFLYAMARHFPQTHFVLSIGNQQGFNPHYSYPLACEELLESVKDQFTFAIWSRKNEETGLEEPSPGSYVPQEMSMPGFYAARALLAPGEVGDTAGSSFAAPRIAGCIARLKKICGGTSNDGASYLHKGAHKGPGYTPGRFGSGCVDYAQAARLAAAHGTTLTAQREVPDFDRFLRDYHAFQCLAASKNPSHLFMAFENQNVHHVTRFVHDAEEGKLCQIAPEDVIFLLRELERFYKDEYFSFDQFAHTLIDSPLYRDFPGCASYMFLKHHDDPDGEGHPIEKDYLSCLDEVKTSRDFLELATLAHTDGHLDLHAACFERMSPGLDSREMGATMETQTTHPS